MIAVRKYHGAGNDFILLKDLSGVENIEDFTRKVCHRRYGIGADGLMFPGDSMVADIFMTYYNSDGTRGDMCGNGLRCFCRFVRDIGLIQKDEFTVETSAGIMTVNLGENHVQVNIGKPCLNASQIPVISEKPVFIQESITVLDKTFTVSCVLMGVPHSVIEVEELHKEDVLKYGPLLETASNFPAKTNVNFVKVVGENEIDIDTWERGAGNTLACGTGSCATVFLLNHLGRVGRQVQVNAPGGILQVTIGAGDILHLTGGAQLILEGIYYI